MPVRTYRPALSKARYMVQNSVVESSPPEAIAAREDFAQFRRYVCKHETYPHHEVWYDALITGEDSKCLKGIGGDNLLVLAPRGSSKSTVLLEWVAWVIGRHTAPDVRLPIKILYVSYTIDVAMLKSVEIKQIIQTPEYQCCFPWCRLGEKQSDKLWVVDRQWAGLPMVSEPYTLACSGLKGVATGKRSHLICLDDLIKSSEQIESLAIREKMSRNYNSVLAPTLFEGGRSVCLGTRMSPVDIYATDFTPQRKWQQLVQSAIVKDDEGNEKSYWEAGQSLKFLQEARERDSYSFSFQYMNIVQPVAGFSIDPSWIQYGEIPNIKDFEHLVMGVDLSASLREKSDFTVFVLGGRIGSRFWIIDMRRMKSIGNIEKLDAIVELWRDWECPRIDICVESNAYQNSLSGDFTSYLVNELRIYDLTCIPVPSRSDKLSRLRSITGLLANKLVTFNAYANLSRLSTELINFGAIDHEDSVDSLILTLQGLRGRRRLEIT